MNELGTAFANWKCVCGRHASIEHPIGGYCEAKEIIEKLQEWQEMAFARGVEQGWKDREFGFKEGQIQAYEEAAKIAESYVSVSTSDIYQREYRDTIMAAVAAKIRQQAKELK